MIVPFPARLAGVGALLAVAAACRDMPAMPAVLDTSAISAMSSTLDTIDEIPINPEILWATTTTAFNDGRYGGQPTVKVVADMEYIGNRGSHDITYTIRGDGSELTQRVYNEQNQTYSPKSRHRFTHPVYVRTNKNCGLDVDAHTSHQAWWHVWLSWAPNWTSIRATAGSKAQHLQTEFCRAPEEEAPDDGDNSGGGGGTGGWVTIETCHYWAHYVNGVLVDIELRYCTYDQIPVADE